jgi:ribonucleotide reductase beta subunit family protein with ferritin-like domain
MSKQIKYHSNKYDNNELILKNTDISDRYVLFPIKYNNLFKMYKKQSSVYWVADEINFSEDLKHLDKLTKDEKYFVYHILAFFAGSDGIVMENLGTRFLQDVNIPEAKCFYSFQIAIEAVHSETYSLLIDTYCKDDKEKNDLFKAIEVFPAIKEKADWALKWIDNKESSFAQRLVAFSIIEGVFFSASFCAIFWLKERGLLPGLSFANQLISRDESLHTEFACMLYQYLENKVPEDIVYDMFDEAVNIEDQFINESIKCSMIGMNSKLMKDYIYYIADRVLVMLGYNKKYFKENPFHFMEYSSIDGKTNFFDAKVSEYQMASINIETGKSAIPDKIEISDDF